MADEKLPNATRMHGSYGAPHSEIGAGAKSSEMWMDVAEPDDPGRRLAMDGEADADSIFYGAFPSLADFPCISPSNSSSLSAGGAAISTTSCSSSSSSSRAPSWAAKPDPDENSERLLPFTAKDVEMAERQLSLPPMQEEEVEGMDVMEDLSDMELLDSSGMWDPSSLFSAGDVEDEKPQQQQQLQLVQLPLEEEEEEDNRREEDEEKRRPSEDLAMVFFEWLKTNKEAISPEDLRSIRLKRSTIECAAKRLGGGKEGMKQLLKLILAWVQNHHLQKRKNSIVISKDGDYGQQQQPMPLQVQFPGGDAWMNPHLGGGYLPDPMLPPPAQFHPQMMVGFAVGGGGEGGYSGGGSSAMPPQNQNGQFGSGCGDYSIVDGNLSWAMNYGGYGGGGVLSDPQQFVGYGGKFGGFAGQHGVLGEPLLKMAPSVTKEARKKRMARQRRIFSHHQHRHHQHHQHQNQQQQHHSANGAVEHPSARLPSSGNCTTENAGGNSSSSWMMWSSSASTSPSPTAMLSPEGDPQPQQRQMVLDRRQVSEF